MTFRPAPLLAAAVLLATLAPAAAQDTGGIPVHVAVLDSGIDAAHEELEGRVARHSFVTPPIPRPPIPGLPDPFAQRPDPDGQGTAVASRVAGRTLSRAPDAGLVDLQVSAKYTATPLTPGGAIDPATEAAAADAMDWLLANHGGNGSDGPRIALLSFATRDLSGQGAATIAAAAEELFRRGVLVIVPAAGNGSLHASPYVLTVGLASATGCGPVAASPANALKPDVAAEGDAVTVAAARRNLTDGTDATTVRSGAQYAAADVASLAAAIWKDRPDLPVAALAAILRGTARDVGAHGADACTGFGVVDHDAALAAARAWSDPAPRDELAKGAPGLGLALALAPLAVAAWRRRPGQAAGDA